MCRVLAHNKRTRCSPRDKTLRLGSLGSAPVLEKLVCTAMDLLCKREISDEDAAAVLTAGDGITTEQAAALVSLTSGWPSGSNGTNWVCWD